MDAVIVFMFAWFGLLSFSAVIGALSANFVALFFRSESVVPSFKLFACVFLLVSYLLVMFFHLTVFVPVWNKL